MTKIPHATNTGRASSMRLPLLKDAPRLYSTAGSPTLPYQANGISLPLAFVTDVA